METLFRHGIAGGVVAKNRLVKATERLGHYMIVVHLQEDLLRLYQRYGHLTAAAEAEEALMENRVHLLAALGELDRAQREAKQTG